MSELYFNGTNLTTTYGCKVESVEGKYTLPCNEYETQSVMGLTGDVLVSHGRQANITVSYDCYINGSFNTNFRNLIAFLNSVKGYCYLYDTSDTKRIKGYLSASVSPKMAPGCNAGKFTLQFSCVPKWETR